MVLRRHEDRGLTTLLFTDIVGSSEVAVALGDRRWHHLQSRHHAEVRKQLRRHGGREVDTAGDGFFVTFRSPAAGVRCAFAIVRGVRELGLDVRSGLHIGEAELAGEKVGGIAVTTAARVSAVAGPGQVLATDTIVHLVAGSGLEFSDLGSRELKGVPGRWELFSLDAVGGESIGAPLDPQQATDYRLRASPVEQVPARKRIAWPVVLAVAVVLTAAFIFVSRRQSTEQPQAPGAGPAVHETVVVLSAGSGNVLFRPTGVASSGQTGAVGTGGPIVLTPPGGRAHQAFAWIVSGVAASGGGHQQLQQVNQEGGAVARTITHLTTCDSPPGCLANMDGRVWFLSPPKGGDPRSQGVFAQGIDLTTGKWAAPLLVGRSISLLGDVRGMTAGEGALWIGDTVSSKVYRLDLRTEHVEPYAIEGSVDDIAFGGGYLWVIDAVDGRLTRIDPLDGRREGLSLNTAGTLSSIGTGGGYVWITDDTDDVVFRVSTDLEVTPIAVGDRPDDVVYAGGTVWVANYGDDTISKVDPGLAQETARYPVGIQPRALAVADGKVWVAGNLLGVNTS